MIYNKFDACIFDFSHGREPDDYWHDGAILEAAESLKNFTKDDWEALLK
ncbi:hypothetical protein SOASR030_35350 [Leminorella grimontii]|uniref:Uncharacterized protein n=1 Tax=Leminorella grimontii TaxID=82981 RepID=A0AAV5N7H1_9GAMM|nr:hypothetical protein [Leminorella grimontii]KFC94412.1 hypothetical protein GLGR_2759 [Leminorella grimontii ATCC 33999 = DSM 5078]GKX57423.1 hypothetical protein SOASR030_35350 [Leminorella grimontii]